MTKTKYILRIISQDFTNILTKTGDIIILILLLPLQPLIKRAEKLEEQDTQATQTNDYFDRSERGYFEWINQNQKSFYHHSQAQPRVGGKFAKQS